MGLARGSDSTGRASPLWPNTLSHVRSCLTRPYSVPSPTRTLALHRLPSSAIRIKTGCGLRRPPAALPPVMLPPGGLPPAAHFLALGAPPGVTIMALRLRFPLPATFVHQLASLVSLTASSSPSPPSTAGSSLASPTAPSHLASPPFFAALLAASRSLPASFASAPASPPAPPPPSGAAPMLSLRLQRQSTPPRMLATSSPSEASYSAPRLPSPVTVHQSQSSTRLVGAFTAAPALSALPGPSAASPSLVSTAALPSLDSTASPAAPALSATLPMAPLSTVSPSLDSMAASLSFV